MRREYIILLILVLVVTGCAKSSPEITKENLREDAYFNSTPSVDCQQNVYSLHKDSGSEDETILDQDTAYNVLKPYVPKKIKLKDNNNKSIEEPVESLNFILSDVYVENREESVIVWVFNKGGSYAVDKKGNIYKLNECE